MQQLLADLGLLIIGGGLLIGIVSIFAHFPTRRDPAHSVTKPKTPKGED